MAQLTREDRALLAKKRFTRLVIGGVLAVVALIATCAYGFPHYRVYSQQLRGEAALREAEFTRKIEIEGAKATLESAKLHKQSEIIRAEGVAAANEIVADGLGGPEGYLRYLWIQGLQDGSSEVIYIATEAGLPILEAGRGLDSED